MPRNRRRLANRLRSRCHAVAFQDVECWFEPDSVTASPSYRISVIVAGAVGR